MSEGLTDTQILDGVIAELKWHVQYMQPLSPLAAREWLDEIHKDRYPLRLAHGMLQSPYKKGGPYDGDVYWMGDDGFHVKQTERRGDDDECKHQTS
jgi:hypothetical protein